MEWYVVLIICTAVIIFTTIVCECISKRPKQKPLSEQSLEYEKTISQLEANITVLRERNSYLEERGDRHSACRDDAEKRLAELQDLFSELMKQNGGQVIVGELAKATLAPPKP